jgi:serine/threonine-protein kinase
LLQRPSSGTLGLTVRGFATFVALCVCLLLSGCRAPDESVPVAQWMLTTNLDPSHSTSSVTLPAKLPLPDEDLTYTLTTAPSLGPSQRADDLVFVIPHLEARVDLWVNGVPATRLDSSRRDGYRTSAPIVFAIPRDAGSELRLTLQVRHRWSKSGWFFAVPRIERFGAVDPEVESVRFVNGSVALFACSGLIQIGVIYLAIYLFDRRRMAYLWFGIQGLAAAFYVLFVQGWPQYGMGRYDIAATSFGVAIASIASVYFTHAFFGLAKPSKLWAFAAAVISGVALFWHDPYAVIGRIAPTIFVIAAAMLYQMGLCIRLLLRAGASPGAGLLLLAWACLSATAWSDMAAWLGIGEYTQGARTACFGLAAFALIQSLLLGKQHFGSLAHTDVLNVQLQGRIEELEQRESEVRSLNDELKRQIADRSRQLFAALGLIGRRDVKPLLLVRGTVVQGRYEVVRKVGSGGMGTVYEARRLRDGVRVALKVARGLDGVELARMAREAQIAATVTDPNVVGILDVDVADDGFLYLVLEYVEGPDFGRLHERFGDAAFVYDVFGQVARGLLALHAAGVVHRDLKPANVLVALGGPRPVVKLADFGISRAMFGGDPPVTAPSEPRPEQASQTVPEGIDVEDALDTRMVTGGEPSETSSGSRSLRDTSSSLTLLGQVIGTPSYIAPELIAGPAALSPAADAFSFGVMAYELLAGHKPFLEPAIVACMEGRPMSTPPPLAALRTDLDAAVTACIHRCLDATPTKRPSADEIASVFASAASSQ